ncbi:enoyl-CoA hydratase-related protein [Hoeflea sp. EC-HK425]|uniref:enoyl-CoA hydratase/isomerase family protein n=1 Tax=Hoeflea sp. EC-HK425 TaxID=2038388 RepID=UPI00125C74F4|nr:enoyl-CoA hydratase-related protein [Hoeflea sp. EC-HK425]VVT01146.1 Enoyl-CoA hydratase/carnithine racemase [Hoeflea sp. EC-HK425]
MNYIEVERHERGIVRLVMNHATARNAMGEALRGELLSALEELLPDPRTRVLLIASALKDFSVGGDLSRMDTLSDPKAGRERIVSAHRLARLLLANDKPVIAEVKGHAVGAGAGLALICDTIVMGESASIGFPFFRVGLVPDFAIAYTLPKRMGFSRARQALLYARSFGSAEAMREGIADDVVADDEVEAKAMERARQLAAFPSHALALTKRMLEYADDPMAVLEFEAMAQPLCFATDDFREGLSAFRDKRKPLFDPEIE